MKKVAQLVAVILFTLSTVALTNAQETKQTAEQLRKEATVLLDQGKVSDAIEGLKAAISTDSQCHECWVDLEGAMRRLHDGKVPLDAWDAIIKDHPQSSMPHLFKAVALFRNDQFSQADDELAKASNLEPRNPYVYGYAFQIHTLNGDYEKALVEHIKYNDLGGAKIFEKVARQYGFLLIALDRQLNGENLPTANWKMPEDFSAFASPIRGGMPFLLWLVSGVEDRKIIVGDPRSKGDTWFNKKYTYKGSEDEALEYAPGLYVWDATILVTQKDGILLLNGTKLKQIMVAHGSKTTRTGVVRNWLFEFEQRPPLK